MPDDFRCQYAKNYAGLSLGIILIIIILMMSYATPCVASMPNLWTNLSMLNLWSFVSKHIRCKSSTSARQNVLYSYDNITHNYKRTQLCVRDNVSTGTCVDIYCI